MAVAVSLDSIDPALVKINKGGENRPSSSVFPFFLVSEGRAYASQRFSGAL